jgi:DNA-binding response OmpR family regulator
VKVLIIEDIVDCAESLATLLRIAGHDVLIALDGIRGLEIATEFRPAVTILDIGLPRLDGYQVARRLKIRCGNDVVIIGVSGYCQPDDVARGKEAGIDHYWAKPIDPGELIDFLARLAASTREHCPHLQHGPTTPSYANLPQ